jgi:hypothetical protein
VPSASVQISTPTSESNSIISALAFDTVPSSSAPWGTGHGFATSPTVQALPFNSAWFALAQVPVPTPVAPAGTIKTNPASEARTRDTDEADGLAKCGKRPRLDIPEEGFHQVPAHNTDVHCKPETTSQVSSTRLVFKDSQRMCAALELGSGMQTTFHLSRSRL